MTAQPARLLFVALGLLLIFSMGCATTHKPASVSADWVKVDVGKVFSIELPPGYREVPVQTIDTFGRVFQSPTVEIHCGYGPGRWNDGLAYQEELNFEKVETTIDGRTACLGTFDRRQLYQKKYTRFIALSVPRVYVFSGIGVEVFANCVDGDGVEEVKRILQTIRFK